MKFLWVCTVAGSILFTGISQAQDKAAYGAYGIDTAALDKSVKPGDSFYHYVNGTWLKTAQIPPDRSSTSLFAQLDELSQKRTQDILKATASGALSGANAYKIGVYYKTFMDEVVIEAKGIQPIQEDLDALSAIKDRSSLVRAFAGLGRRLTVDQTFTPRSNNPFGVWFLLDERQPDRYIPVVFQDGLGLPDRDMYDQTKTQFDAVRAGYRQYIVAMFKLAGLADAEQRATAVYALEEKLAAVHWSRVDDRDLQKRYNKMTPAQLKTIAPGLDWDTWIEAMGLEQVTHFNINQPSAIAGMARLVQSEPLPVWRDYLALRTITEAAPYLSSAFVNEHFAFYGKTLLGTKTLRDRWKRGVADVNQAMGEAVGELYVARHFTPETKAHADQLVKNLLIAMRHRLEGLSWMSAQTKAKAKEKLSTYVVKIGYPERWRNYKALEIREGDALGNARRAAQFENDRRRARLKQPVDKTEWGMVPMTVNAYYDPTLNEIVFPAAILQPPYFDPKADDAVNYGAIGAVIGHEISHGFDDQGSQYDATGTLKNWWTDQDSAKFKEATTRLSAQYDQYCPFEDQCVKGALTLGENIADLAGLTLAYEAYKLSLKGNPPPVIEGVTGDQRFFMGWAQAWRRLYRDQTLKNLLVTDVHSPSQYRTDGIVRNLDAWYKAFDVKPGDRLYLTPAQRVKIW